MLKDWPETGLELTDFMLTKVWRKWDFTASSFSYAAVLLSTLNEITAVEASGNKKQWSGNILSSGKSLICTFLLQMVLCTYNLPLLCRDQKKSALQPEICILILDLSLPCVICVCFHFAQKFLVVI